MNKKVDQYLLDGCGRCEKYLTPECNVHTWSKELELLRSILLQTELKEDYKWSQPCYTYKGKNIAMISAFNKSACLSFFKGALIQDESGLLEFPGENSRVSKRALFKSTGEILKHQSSINKWISQAIEIEKQGKQVAPVQVDAPYPEELLRFFKEDKKLESAFKALTPGRQRSYLLHFNQAKQSQTKINRIEKSIPKILVGLGFNEYKK